MKFRLHPFAESRVRRRMETAAGVVDDHHVPAPVQLGDQKGPDEVVGHPSAGVPIIPDMGGASRDELSRLQPRVDTAKDGDRPMLPFGSHGVLGHSIGPAGYQRLVLMSGTPQLVLKIRRSHIGMEFWHTGIYPLRGSGRPGRVERIKRTSPLGDLRGARGLALPFAVLAVVAVPASAVAGSRPAT